MERNQKEKLQWRPQTQYRTEYGENGVELVGEGTEVLFGISHRRTLVYNIEEMELLEEKTFQI